MTVEVIPAGSSVVVSDDSSRWVNTMEAIKDAQADSVRTTKDAEAQLSKQEGTNHADTVKTVKDAQAALAHQLGSEYADIVKNIKDTQSQVISTSSVNTMNLIQDIKDAEVRLDRASGDRFINTIQDIKDFEARTSKDNNDKFVDIIQDVKDLGRDAGQLAAHTDEQIMQGFSTQRMEFQQAVRELEKVAYQNQMSVMGSFKDQALLSERLAAHQALLSEKLAASQALLSERLANQVMREAQECCCEVKRDVDSVKGTIKDQELARLREQLLESKIVGSRFRNFSPVPAGTLFAHDDE